MAAEKMPGIPLSEIAQAVTPPAREVAFTPEEARRGRKLVGNTLVYCCYGMYCDAGHSPDCKFADGLTARCTAVRCTCSPSQMLTCERMTDGVPEGGNAPR